MRHDTLLSVLFVAGGVALPRAFAAAQVPPPAADAKATPPEEAMTQKLFAAQLARMRRDSPELADEFAALDAELAPLVTYGSSSIGDVGADALTGYQRRLNALHDHAQNVEAKLGLDPAVYQCNVDSRHPFDPEYVKGFDYACLQAFNTVSSRFAYLAGHNLPPYFKKDAERLGDVELRATALEKDVNAGTPTPESRAALNARLAAINAEGTDVWNAIQSDALHADEGGGHQDLANPLEKRVADLVRRLQAVDATLNGDHSRTSARAEQRQGVSAAVVSRLSDPFAHGSADAGVGAAGAAIGGVAGSGARAVAPAPVPARTTLLDLNTSVPAPVSVSQSEPKPPVNAGLDKKENAAPKETEAVDALRAKGQTLTIGDPGARAAYVYQQTGETCAIGAQVVVAAIERGGAADPKRMAAEEDRLFGVATSLGYFSGSAADLKRRENGGTPTQYVGDLLETPTVKRYDSNEKELLGVVKAGRLAVVAVDSGGFYNDPNLRGKLHFAVVTGVETDRAGNPLGYYVNDTGDGEGGRFIAGSQFRGAWKKAGSFVVVPQ